MKLVSWNVNGIRAVGKKGFADWFTATDADCVSLQEVKAHQEQVPPEVITFKGYEVFWNAAKKPGYSGTACLTRKKPKSVKQGLGIKKFDDEGRVLQIEFDRFILLNCYFPNSQPDHARLPYKLEFCAAIQEYCDRVRSEKKEIVICGDFNIAHQEIDLARPKANLETSGFLPEERAWMTSFLKTGMRDVHREQNPSPVKGSEYTWWSYRANARGNNVGWRIDYHVTSEGLVNQVKKTWHECKTVGSDHCPVGIELNEI